MHDPKSAWTNPGVQTRSANKQEHNNNNNNNNMVTLTASIKKLAKLI